MSSYSNVDNTLLIVTYTCQIDWLSSSSRPPKLPEKIFRLQDPTHHRHLRPLLRPLTSQPQQQMLPLLLRSPFTSTPKWALSSIHRSRPSPLAQMPGQCIMEKQVSHHCVRVLQSQEKRACGYKGSRAKGRRRLRDGCFSWGRLAVAGSYEDQMSPSGQCARNYGGCACTSRERFRSLVVLCSRILDLSKDFLNLSLCRMK